MGKLISQIVVSLDGYFAGRKGSLDWHRIDDGYNDYAAGLLQSAGAVLFGRVTYELLAGYWPTDAAASNDRRIADSLNRLPKFVVSRTLNKPQWQHTEVVGDAADEELAKLKNRFELPLVILGSGSLAADLLRRGYVDELHLMVNPVVVGEGAAFFPEQAGNTRRNFQLLEARSFASGNVLLRYNTSSS